MTILLRVVALFLFGLGCGLMTGTDRNAPFVVLVIAGIIVGIATLIDVADKP